MKLLKIIAIVLFSLLVSFPVIFAQEKNTTDSSVKSVQQDNISGTVPVSEMEKNPITETKTETVKTDSLGIKQSQPVGNKDDTHKKVNKKSSEKKVLSSPAVTKQESASQVKIESDLLLISEGNFKYKRIPDIKLADIKPEAVDSNTKVAEAVKPVKNTSTGFFGLSKTASDIIVKGGILLLILLIFILYKSRMSGPGNKSTKKRNVLNSYRK